MLKSTLFSHKNILNKKVRLRSDSLSGVLNSQIFRTSYLVTCTYTTCMCSRFIVTTTAVCFCLNRVAIEYKTSVMNTCIMYEAFNWSSTCCNDKSTCSHNKSTCAHNQSTCHDKPFLRQHDRETVFSRIWHRSIVFVTIRRHNKSTYCYNSRHVVTTSRFIATTSRHVVTTNRLIVTTNSDITCPCCYNKSTCRHNKSTCRHNKSIYCNYKSTYCYGKSTCRYNKSTCRYKKSIYCCNKSTYCYNESTCRHN